MGEISEMKTLRCDVTIFGGLPLKCEFQVGPPEPDVGIFTHYIDDPVLYDERGRHADWAEKRMDDDDWQEVQAQCWDYWQKMLSH